MVERSPGHCASYDQICELNVMRVPCQKMRHALTEALFPITRHMKTANSRPAVLIDHLSVEAVDYVMTGAHGVRDLFNEIIFIYTVKEQSAVSAATSLFLYSTYYECFDYLMRDPDTEFMSEIISEPNPRYGIHHRVSLVDRHQSNCVEGGNKVFLRHISMFLCENPHKKS